MIKNGNRVYEVIKHILCNLLRSIIQQRLIKCINKNITQTKQLLSPMYDAILGDQDDIQVELKA